MLTEQRLSNWDEANMTWSEMLYMCATPPTDRSSHCPSVRAYRMHNIYRFFFDAEAQFDTFSR